MSIEQLDKEFGIPSQLKVIEGKGGFPIIEIDSSKAKAKISVYAGQVISFQPAGEPHDLIFLSENAYYQTGKAMKGGIPICWPWFGPDPEGKGRASHGFVRNRIWDLLGTETVADGDIKVTLGVAPGEETKEIWPHSFELTIEITVGAQLTVALLTKNTGDKAFTITQAFHTYFSTGDISQVRVIGLDNAPYIDKVDNGAEKTQHGDIRIAEEVDRIYTQVKPELAIEDGKLGRRIQISTTGSSTAIVWNPWKEISVKMADLEDNDYQRFVCVETANAADEVITVSPGEQYKLQATYAVERS